MNDQSQQQPVADPTNAPAQQGAEGGSAPETGDELDRALAEFANRNKLAAPASPSPPEPKQTQPQQPAVDPVMSAELDRIRNRLFRSDMNDTIKTIRGEMDPGFFDDAFVRGWIEARADDNPELGRAWVDRDTNPKGFQKVVNTLSREFAKRYGKLPDKAATEDREAVTHAVRGASTKAPEGKPPNYGGMSDHEFKKSISDQYGFDPM